MRIGEVQQFRDNGEHAVEVAGAGSSLEHIADRSGHNSHERIAGGIHLIWTRRIQQVDVLGSTKVKVSIECAWIPIKIFAWSKLQWVEEVGDDDAIGTPAGLPNQLGVTGMQSTHRHDHSDRGVLASPRGTRLDHI
jgi:hypothetical protein